MKIMIIPTSYPDAKNPVRNIYIYEQAKALANLGHKITVLHLQKQPSKAFLKPMSKKISINDDGFATRYSRRIKTFMEGKFPGLHRAGFVKGIKQLFDIAVQSEGLPDVIYAHFSCWAGYAAVQIGREYHIPVVSIEHFNKFINNRADKAMIEGLKCVIEGSAANLAVSENLRDSILRLTGTDKPVEVMPNMIDDRFVYCAPTEHEGFVFSAVANLNKGKRFDLLINAFCEAFSAEENVKLLIGGSGSEKENLLALISQNRREHQIQLLGRLDRDQTLQVYQQSDCFALPSAFETFGIVWREAMAVGRPVITTDHGGWSREEWSDDFGIMTPVDDKQALVAALREIRNEYKKYNLEEISRFARENYAAGVIGKRIESVLEKAVREYT